MQKMKPIAQDLNPKAVTNDELFGVINPATREWKDGLFSVIMRDLANITHDGPKWIVLDGDIDPMWIESLNTVMDDNKVGSISCAIKLPPAIFYMKLFHQANPGNFQGFPESIHEKLLSVNVERRFAACSRFY